MQKDFDYRLCAMRRAAAGRTRRQRQKRRRPATGAGPQQNPGTVPQTAVNLVAGAQSRRAVQRGGAIHLARRPACWARCPPARATRPAPATATGRQRATPARNIDAAMNLLAKAQYDEARAAFRAFADANPAGRSGAAGGLLGRRHRLCARRIMPSAARAFAEEIKKYPTSPRAPDSMLKLGQSLIALAQKRRLHHPCRAPGKYPTRRKTLLDQGEDAREKARCQ